MFCSTEDLLKHPSSKEPLQIHVHNLIPELGAPVSMKMLLLLSPNYLAA